MDGPLPILRRHSLWTAPYGSTEKTRENEAS